MRGLVAINIVNKDVLYNKEHPLLMYYDGKNSIEDTIKSQKELHQYIIEKVISLSSWETTCLLYISYYSESDKLSNDELSDTGKILIKDIVSFDEVFYLFIKDALLKAFGVDSIEEANNLGLSKPTIINGVRSVVVSSGISRDTCMMIIKKIQEEIK